MTKHTHTHTHKILQQVPTLTKSNLNFMTVVKDEAKTLKHYITTNKPLPLGMFRTVFSFSQNYTTKTQNCLNMLFKQ